MPTLQEELFSVVTNILASPNPGEPDLRRFQELLAVGGPRYLFIPNNDKKTVFTLLKQHDVANKGYSPNLFFKDKEAFTTDNTTCVEQLYQQYAPDLGAFEKVNAQANMFEKLNQLVTSDAEDINLNVLNYYIANNNHSSLYISAPNLYLQKKYFKI
jgi:hypothetical protein